jgi:hypothetical protein
LSEEGEEIVGDSLPSVWCNLDSGEYLLIFEDKLAFGESWS